MSDHPEYSGADRVEAAVPKAGEPLESKTEKPELDELDREISQLWDIELGGTEMAVGFNP
jgi:hypothetical protein